MRAVLRYRRIPYLQIYPGSPEFASLPKPKVQLQPTFFLPDEKGELSAVVDSTPLIRRFEREYSGREIVPSDPVIAFINDLLEDFGDEFVTKYMFHYRWAHQANVDKAAAVLPFYTRTDIADEQVAPFVKMIGERQVKRLYVVGSNEITAPIIEESYRRYLRLLSTHLAAHPFQLGGRPSSSDFAAFGQLTQTALFDTTAVATTLDEAPRVIAWVERVEDLSGLEPSDDDWITRDAVPDSLRGILSEVGRCYVPCMRANADALARGEKQMSCEVDGKEWVQPAFPYQGKCVEWLRAEYGALDATDRIAVDAILEGTGCEALF
jgi:glutathione S-transferase